MHTWANEKKKKTIIHLNLLDSLNEIIQINT